MSWAEFSKRRSQAYADSVYSEGRLGVLRTVFDGWGVALIGQERTPAVTVRVPNGDYELVADALERGLPRCSFNSQYGLATPNSDGDVDMSNYDWNTEVTGKVTLPREHVPPFVELLRSVPGGDGTSVFGVDFGADDRYSLLVLRRGMPDRLGEPWAHESPLLELYEVLRSSEGRKHGQRFLAALDLQTLLARDDGEPLQVSTPDSEITIDGGVMDTVIRRLRPRLLNARHPHVT